MILIYVVCKNKAESKKIGLDLIKKRLAGCCNIFPIESFYWWQEKTIRDSEVVLLMKTLRKNFKKIKNVVKKMHSYKVPCIIEIPIRKVNSEYLKWLRKEIK